MSETINELTRDINESVTKQPSSARTTQELVKEIRDAVTDGVMSESDVKVLIAEVVDGAPEAFDTLKEISDYINKVYTKTQVDAALNNKANASDLTDHINNSSIHTTPSEKADISDLKFRVTNLEQSVIGIHKDLFDGTKATYRKLMKQWFLANGAETATPAELTALCDYWYDNTRIGWNGWTTFSQPDVSTSSTGTKGGDNAGLNCVPSTATVANTDDYMGLPLFAIVDCNWILDDNGDIVITAIDGISSGFERDNPSKFVGVLQQTGYHYYINDEETYTHGIADSMVDGSKPYPEAVRNDNTIRPWVCHGKYMSGTVDGKPTCCAGVIPTVFTSHDTLITIPDVIGAQYSGGTLVDIAFLYLMSLIKYGSMTQD